MRNALIAGATGLTGRELTLQLIRSDYYNSLHIIGRHHPDIEHSKLKSYIVDFEKLADFKPEGIIHDVYICLGTTIKKAGSRENFRKVDYQYVLEIGNWARENEVEKVAVISSLGTKPDTRNFYLKTKAEMEAAMTALCLPSLLIIRPSLLLGKRKEFRWAEKLATVFMKPLNRLMLGRLRRYKAVQASAVARAMFKGLINAEPGVTILENEGIGLYQE